MYLLVVHPVEGQLTRSVDQVGEADEGFHLVHVQDQHGCHGGHTLHLGERHPERVRHRERERERETGWGGVQVLCESSLKMTEMFLVKSRSRSRSPPPDGSRVWDLRHVNLSPLCV